MNQTAPSSGSRRHPGVYVALALLAVLTAACEAVVLFFVFFGYSTTCNEAATGAEVRAGELAILVVLAVAAVPWALAAALIKPRRGVMVAGVLALSPALIALLVGLDPDTWRGSFCF